MASGTQIVPGMLGVYNDLLSKNVSNYQNAIGAYGQGQAQIAQSAPGITGAYGRISDDIQQTLGMGKVLGQNGNWGVAAPAAQAIAFTLQQGKAANDQQMTNRGLGNSTIRSNLNSQMDYNAVNAYGHLGADLAQAAASARERVGLAQQAAQMQTLGLQTNLSAGLGSSLAGYHFANTAGNLLGGYSTDVAHTAPGQSLGGDPAGSGLSGRGSPVAGPGGSSYSGNAGGGMQIQGSGPGEGNFSGAGPQTINMDPYWFGAGATGFGLGGSPGPAVQFGSGSTSEAGGVGVGAGPTGPATAVGVGDYWDEL